MRQIQAQCDSKLKAMAEMLTQVSGSSQAHADELKRYDAVNETYKKQLSELYRVMEQVVESKVEKDHFEFETAKLHRDIRLCKDLNIDMENSI